MSYLFERSDFAELVEMVAASTGIPNAAIVEKDYYVTEALRLMCQHFGDVVIFKGGTSLSKGWKIIERFSEDIDLYVKPAESEEATLARFAQIAATVATHPGFTGRLGRTDKGSCSWTEEFSCESKVSTFGGLRPVVLLEAGIQSADQPTETRVLTSLLGETLDSRGVASGTDDRAPFAMKLLHFRRTFVEKLFTLHSRVERVVRQSRDLGRDARHYYDLAKLLDRAETTDMMASAEYALICGQYRDLTAKFYPGQVKLLPEGMRLVDSRALYPPDALREGLEAAYIREADSLCYGPYPGFAEVLGGFAGIRDKLDIHV